MDKVYMTTQKDGERIQRTIHIGFAKSLLIRLIREHGVAEILEDWTGTEDEAIVALEACPYDVITSPECNNRGPDGACQGHERI